MLQFKTLSALFVLFITIASFGFYKFGSHISYKKGYDEGRLRGQVELILELENELNYSLNGKTFKVESHRHFKDISDISVYIYETNGVKSIAVWE